MTAKHYYMQFNVGDWLKDPAVASCSAATRGVWFDLLCAMHEAGRSGQLSKTKDLMARLGRCSAAELDHALTDLQATGAADVTVRNGIVTVINRRMRREAKVRDGNKVRQKRHRQNVAANAPVTPTPEPEPEPKISLDQRKDPEPPLRRTAPAPSGSKRLRSLALGLDVLRDPLLFDQWCRSEMTHPKGFVKTDADREFALAAREKALSDTTLRNPIGWLKDVLRYKRRERVPATAHEALHKPKGPMDVEVAALLQMVADKRKAMV